MQIVTVGDLAKAISGFDQESKIRVRPEEKVNINVVDDPDGNTYIEVKLIQGEQR